ncbi:MAG: outer membrane protein [Alphaproteobacteria bacterium]
MKKLLATTALCLAVASGSANAESFNGPYVGLDIGHSWGTYKESGTITVGATTGNYNEKTSLRGFEGGLHAGYRSAIFNNNFILGGEIGYIRSGADKREAFTFDGNSLDLKTEKRNEFYLSVKPGIKASESTLFYGILGAQWTKGKSTLTDNTNGDRSSESERFRGYHVGAGAELATTRNASLRIEYKYQDYRSKSFNFNEGGLSANGKSRFDENVVRVGLSYNF